jgi:hypothetical protein
MLMHPQLNILLLLCEEALATCELFRTRTSMDEDGMFFFEITARLCNIWAAEDVRGAPVCIDKDGAYYWYMADDRSVQRRLEYFPTHLFTAQLQYTKNFLPASTKSWALSCPDPAKWLPCVIVLSLLALDVTNFAGLQFGRGDDQFRNIVETQQT